MPSEQVKPWSIGGNSTPPASSTIPAISFPRPSTVEVVIAGAGWAQGVKRAQAVLGPSRPSVAVLPISLRVRRPF